LTASEVTALRQVINAYVVIIVIITPHRSTIWLWCSGVSLQTEWHGLSIGLSVCRSVGHSREPCKSGRTDRDAVRDVDLSGPKEPCIRWALDPHTEGAIWEGRRYFPRTPPSTVSSGLYVRISRMRSTSVPIGRRQKQPVLH